MEEIWKDIEGYNKYQVSNLGRVKSVARVIVENRTGNIIKRKEKILSPRLTSNNANWYFTVALYGDNGIKNPLIHRLVAMAFIPNPENKSEVNHISGDKNDNSATNLEWVTPLENREHCKKIGLSGKGENHSQVKVTEQQVIELRSREYKYGDKKKVCAELGITNAGLWSILMGYSWKHIPYNNKDQKSYYTIRKRN